MVALAAGNGANDEEGLRCRRDGVGERGVRKLTQARAAAVLGINQPKVSVLVRGKLDGFSTNRLFRFLNALGQDVEIVVRPRRQENGHASTRVVSV
jgi:hypothetical protein